MNKEELDQEFDEIAFWENAFNESLEYDRNLSYSLMAVNPENTMQKNGSAMTLGMTAGCLFKHREWFYDWANGVLNE